MSNHKAVRDELAYLAMYATAIGQQALAIGEAVTVAENERNDADLTVLLRDCGEATDEIGETVKALATSLRTLTMIADVRHAVARASVA
jgi:hypothetical protein